eukprot:gene39713-53693_t
MITVKKWLLMNFAGWFLGWQFIVGLGMGLGVGLAQWLALRKQIPVTFNWIWVTTLGLVSPQNLLKTHIANTQNWVITNIIGWLLAVLAFSAINYTMKLSIGNLSQFFLNLGLMLAGGPILGYAT